MRKSNCNFDVDKNFQNLLDNLDRYDPNRHPLKYSREKFEESIRYLYDNLHDESYANDWARSLAKAHRETFMLPEYHISPDASGLYDYYHSLIFHDEY